jgi:hypothetical protein
MRRTNPPNAWDQRNVSRNEEWNPNCEIGIDINFHNISNDCKAPAPLRQSIISIANPRTPALFHHHIEAENR